MSDELNESVKEESKTVFNISQHPLYHLTFLLTALKLAEVGVGVTMSWWLVFGIPVVLGLGMVGVILFLWTFAAVMKKIGS